MSCLHLQCLQQRYSSKLMKAGDMATLTVYQCKPKKNVGIHSSLHMSVALGKSKKMKLETVEFYIKTKCGVDVVDQMAMQYSVKADTCQWLVAVFYILDLASIIAFVLCKKLNFYNFHIFAYNFQIYSFFSLLEKSWHGFARFTVGGLVYCKVR